MDSSSQGEVTTLSIDPATAAISVVNGKATPVAFKAIATYENGQKTAIDNASWTRDFPNIATVDNAGKVSATGQLGGIVKLTATLNTKSATAQLTVNLKNTVLDPTVSAANQALLEAGGPADTSVAWQYPYEGTVFPRGLAAPSLMWKGSLSGDLYEIIAQNDYISHKVFTAVEPSAKFDWPKAAWVNISESGPGGPLKFKVRRLSARKGTTIADHTWGTASGTMRATVYSWSATNAAVVRVNPGAAAPDDFLKKAGVTDGCTTCHTVSADGCTLVMGNEESTGDSQATTFDLTSNTLALSGMGREWANPAVSPDGKYVVRNHSALPGYIASTNHDGSAGDGMYNSKTGAKVTTATGLEGDMRGFWSLDPCKKLGADCGAASECCSLICDSKGTCGQPSTSQCSPAADECEVATDCCGTGFQCINKH